MCNKYHAFCYIICNCSNTEVLFYFVLFFRKRLHPTLLGEKSKRSKFVIDVAWEKKSEKMKLGLLNKSFFCLDRTKVESGQRRERKDPDRGRGPRERGRGRGRPEVIQSHSIFEQGPAEMMMKKRGTNSAGLSLCCFG